MHWWDNVLTPSNRFLTVFRFSTPKIGQGLSTSISQSKGHNYITYHFSPPKHFFPFSPPQNWSKSFPFNRLPDHSKLLHTYQTVHTLIFNTKKDKYMIFHTKKKKVQNLTLQIDNVYIEWVAEFNFLGLTLDKHPTLKHHINKISLCMCILTKFPTNSN